jgi:hypothetical protein
MAIDPTELMSPRDRLSYNINMRSVQGGAANGPPSGAHVAPESDFFGADGLGFDDVLDIINPLQQLPVIGTIYRAITGDELSAGARVLGGALYGGPAGLLLGAVDAAATEAAGGTDIGVLALNGVMGNEQTASATTGALPPIALAQVEPAAGAAEAGLVAPPWVDPDAPATVDAPMPGALPRLAALEPAASLDLGDPHQAAAREAAATGFAPRRLPAPNMADRVPTLSEEDVALLLSSIGMKAPEAAAAAVPAPASPEEATAERSLQALDQAGGRASQRRAADAAARAGLGPMKQIYVRAPVGSKAWAQQSFTPDYAAPRRTASDTGGTDQAWVEAAMASALDRYRNPRRDETAAPKGANLDVSY